MNFYYRLYHEEWRTEEMLENQGTNSDDDGFANFNFRGFKGDYEIKLMDGDNEIKVWKKNLENDANWILSID